MATRRGLGLVLTILLLAILVSAAAMVVLMLVVGREPAVASNSVLVLRVEGDLAEAPSDTVFDTFVGARQPATAGDRRQPPQGEGRPPDLGRHREAGRA